MKSPIQKPIRTLLGILSSLSGRIASCFCQPLSFFTRDSQKLLVVAIYSEIKSRNCQDLVKILSFITDIWKSQGFLSLHKARKIYKRVSFLLLSGSFLVQSQLYNVREIICATSFSRYCGIFEGVNDCLSDVSLHLSLCSGQLKHLLAQSQRSGVREWYL